MTKKNDTSITDKAMQYEPLLGTVLNVFLIDTKGRIITVATKNKELRKEQIEYINEKYGNIIEIFKGSSGFTDSVIYI